MLRRFTAARSYWLTLFCCSRYYRKIGTKKHRLAVYACPIHTERRFLDGAPGRRRQARQPENAVRDKECDLLKPFAWNEPALLGRFPVYYRKNADPHSGNRRTKIETLTEIPPAAFLTEVVSLLTRAFGSILLPRPYPTFS